MEEPFGRRASGCRSGFKKARTISIGAHEEKEELGPGSPLHGAIAKLDGLDYSFTIKCGTLSGPARGV
jgi:hypothetical protein